MAISVKAFANADDVLVVWQPDQWSDDWVGFQLERRDNTTQQITVLANRIPSVPGQGPVQPSGVSSTKSPLRRCMWTDHGAVSTWNVSYRVTAMKGVAAGSFAADTASVSRWTDPLVVTGDAGGGLQAYFNRGTLMSQIVSRFVNGDSSTASLHQFLKNLETPGFAARQYLSGDARHEILSFLRDADRRGGNVYLAIYEFNDRELADALKPFGNRGHVLLGNGGATASWVPKELAEAGLEVHHRDLSKKGRTSPSVHNKFVVECDARGLHPSRALTGSTNWTTTGLCTQLNNVLIVDNAAIAARFRAQWDALVEAGDDMPAALKQANAKPTKDGEIALFFAATPDEEEFKPVLDIIAGANHGVLFLMFMPGQSPLLKALLDRAQQNSIYVRGVVSTVKISPAEGDVSKVGGQVIKSGSPPQAFHDDVLVPAGISEADKPSWAETEFTVSEMLSQHLMAIVHSKVIVVDPFSDDCAVITGSHNFSSSASAKNDENLVVIRGNKKLAQSYALHANGVYDHYSWRAFLGSGGDADQIYKPLNGWMPGGSRAQELEFWMNEPITPRAARTAKPRASTKSRSSVKPRPAKKTSPAASKKRAPAKKVSKKAAAPAKTARRPAKKAVAKRRAQKR